MSLGTCLTDLVAKKTISAARAEEMREVYDELVAQYEPKFGRAAAESMATEKAMAAIEGQFLDRKVNILRQAKARATILDNASRLYRRNKTPGKPSPDGLVAHLVDDQHAPFGNVEYRWKNIRDEALRGMYDMLWKHRANLIGDVRHKSDFTDVVMELGGRDTGSINAREFAESWTKTAELLRNGFNAAGGNIPQLEGWALPHQWDGVKTGLISFDEWRADMVAELDRAKMIDRLTGEPMSDMRLDDVLRQVHDSIVSEGAIGREASGQMQGKAFANRRQEHRVLHFSSPEGWLRLNEKYGASHPLDAMLHHIDSMARDTAAMQILGPNPAATIRWMKDLIGNEALTSPSLVARFSAGRHQRTVEHIWDEITGMNRVAARPNVALFFSTMRNWQSATKLGSAAVASLPDMATAGITARFNGLPVMQGVREIASHFNPLDASHRDFARRAFLIQDEVIGRTAGYGRAHFEESQGGALTAPTLDALREGRIGLGDFAALQLRSKLQAANELSRRASQATMRIGLLNQWTMQMRSATAMEFWNAITHFSEKPFGELNDGWRGFLQRYGIDERGWDTLRSTPRTEYKGSEWVLPDSIADHDLRNKITEGIMTELDYAVSTGGIRQRSAMTVGRPGELPHEIVKTAGQFLLFPITVTSRHLSRAWSLHGVTSKAGYASAFLIATTVMGALAEQLSEVFQGKDPRPMNDKNFLWKSMSRGGGLGYYGNILEHSVAENGRGFSDLGNAPVLGSAENWSKLLIQQPWIALMHPKNAKGEERKPNFAKAAANVARYEIPGDNIWYLRLAYQRLLIDHLDEMGDEHPGEAYRRMNRRAKEEGTRYFAPPGGRLADARAPDFSNIFGGNEQAPQQ